MQIIRLKPGQRSKYGLVFPAKPDGTSYNDLEIEFACMLMGGSPSGDKYFHYKKIVQAIWCDLEIHRWLDRTLRAFCKDNFTGLTGCKNSAKSFGMAIHSLISWWADPVNTTVFVTSTYNKDAEQRVWGEVEKLFRAKRVPMPGKVMSSTHMIVLRDVPEDVLNSPRSAIILVAAGEKDALERLQGKKNDRMILVIDEGQSVSNELEEAFFNLKGNNHFEIRCAGNPTNTFDLHGRFCEPALPGGHDNDLENLWEWPIAPVRGIYKGTCVHFNNIDSPNYDREREGLPFYSYLPKPAEVAVDRQHLGLDDQALWRQNIGIWPRGVSVRQTVFTDAELNKFKVREDVEFVTSERGFGIDPAYTEFGDQFIVRPFDWGLCLDGLSRMRFLAPIPIKSEAYSESGTLYHGPFAQAKRVRDLAKEHGVPAKYIGVDDTGRNPIKAILDAELGGTTLGVGFGDGASDELIINLTEDKVASDAYFNKGTEMWYSLRQFAEHDQLRGLGDTATVKQLSNRKFINKSRSRVALESKQDYKKRVGGKSPDETDAAAVATAVARERMGAIPGLKVVQQRQKDWTREIHRHEVPAAKLQGTGGLGRLQGGGLSRLSR